ncbi:MAG: hypothetical protein ABFD62_09725 [Syntrophaceae bacterium]
MRLFKKSILVCLSMTLMLSPLCAWAQKINRKQTETPVARLSFSPLIQKTFTVSPDSRRIAYVDQAVGKQCVVIDGLSQSCYDEVLTRPLFSPDSKRIAYVARKGAGKFIVVDGKEQKPCNDIVGYPRFSPDSKKVAFVARSGGGECVVIDGAEGEKFDEIGRTGIRNGKVVFSPDGKRIAYVARSGDSQFVVADGVKQKEYEIVGSNALCSWGIPVFSPDGKRLGYQAMSGKKWLAVIDGTEGKNYDEVSFIIFSPDSSRTGYLASRGEKRFAVIDGIESKGYDAVDLLSFSPDSQSFAYRAHLRGSLFKQGRWFFVLNGKEVKEFKISGDPFLSYGNFAFSADGRVAYKARLGIVVNDKEEKYFEKTGYPAFSPDGRKLAYMAGTGNRQFSVVNGNRGREYDSLGSRFFLANPVFSPDSRRIAYPARIGEKWTVVIDGNEGQLYDEILVFPGGPRVFESFDNHPYYSCFRDKIETELQSRGKLVFDSPDRIHYLALKGDTIVLVEERIE